MIDVSQIPDMAQVAEWLRTIHAYIFDVDRIPTAIIAIIIAMVWGMIKGPFANNAMPLFWRLIDLVFGKLGARMDKAGRPKGDLIFRGFVLCSVALIFSFGIGRLVEAASLYYPIWSIIEIVTLSFTMAAGSVFAAQGRLYKALNDKKVTPGAYLTVARSTRTDLSRNDDYAITRIGMGMGLKAFDKGIVAPTLWYLILGVTGAYIYAGLAAMQWIFGREGHSSGFGNAINALEKLMGFIPNILSGMLIACAGMLTPTAGMTRAFLGLVRTKGRATYAEGGLPMTAAAYALKVNLGGPTQSLDGYTIKRGWFGPKGATAQLVAKHLHRAVYISFMAHLLFLASLGGAILFSH